ncbi:MAG TPA: hydrogenase maturation nickel metallochaperone HypA, partial [Mycobacterium sp.]
MHEMALTQSLVEAVCEHAAGRRVHSVKLEVGALCAVVPDAMTFCFDLATEGTVAEGARLDVDMRPGAARCRS